MYFDNEVTEVLIKATGKVKIEKLEEIILTNELSKKIFDVQNMCKNCDWIHSKTTFAQLIADDEYFGKNIELNNFMLIYDIIGEIEKIKTEKGI